MVPTCSYVVPHGPNIVPRGSTWFLHDPNMVPCGSIWFHILPHGCHMVATWFPHCSNMFPHDYQAFLHCFYFIRFHAFLRRSPHGHLWSLRSHKSHMVPAGSRMVPTWSHMVPTHGLTWSLHGHVLSLHGQWSHMVPPWSLVKYGPYMVIYMYGSYNIWSLQCRDHI